jgi:DNA ligase 1
MTKNIFGDDFKPMKFPNDSVSFDVVDKPYLASTKLDGFRCVFKNGLMLSNSLKELPCKQLQTRFEHMKRLSKETGLIYDGEIFSPEMTFQKISHFCMTQDLEEEKLPDSLCFNMFDLVDMNNPGLTAIQRYELYKELKQPFVKIIEQRLITTPAEAENMFNEALSNNFEGLMLKNPTGKYKYNRVTTKSGDGFKLKPYRTYDMLIIGIEQATVVDPEAEITKNELGHSRTSKKKGDRIPIEQASAYVVQMDDGRTLKATIAETHEQKQYIWTHQSEFIGKHVEVRAMEVGAKDVPRHPTTVKIIRMREDLDL